MMQLINNIPIWGDPVDEGALAQIKRCAESADHVAMMADHHKGYAVPIGGVVAYAEAISPSGVGYDIACIAEGEAITTQYGFTLPIESVTAVDGLICFDGEISRLICQHEGSLPTGVKQVKQLCLANGRSLRLTSDHLVRTKQGWKRADDLTAIDLVALSPFIGLPYEASMPLLLEDGSEFVVSPAQLATWARLLGVICGDGHVHKNGGHVSIYTTDLCDAQAMVRDYALLGYDAKVYTRSRKPGYLDEVQVRVNSKQLHALVSQLGAPVGRKVWTEEPFPWLFTMPAWVRAQFLSGFASAECMTPRPHAPDIPNLQIKQAGENDNSIRFIGRLFESLNFQVSLALSGPERGNRRDYLLQVLGEGTAQVRFFEQIGFCYARKKRQKAAQTASMIWQRLAHQNNREAARQDARRQHSAGKYWKEVQSEVAQRYGVSKGFVHHAIYDDRGVLRRERGKRFTLDTIDEVCWVQVANVSDAGIVPVYDIPTYDAAHAYYANGIVVHNCGNKAVRLDIPAQEVRDNVKTIMDSLWANLSFGMGRKNKTRVDHELFEDPAWTLKPLTGLKKGATEQLGTIGGGNHYVDLFVDEQERIWCGVHFGSRGLGHKIATHFLTAGGAKDGMDVPPLVLKVDTELGTDYLTGMHLAGRYAYAGRDWVCAEVAKLLGATILEEIHNHHNFAWRENHFGLDLWVVRKGATPAFPGQKGFVGGSMGDTSVILEGVESEEATFALHSTVHGAGRVMSRTEARGKVDRKTGRVVKEGRISDKMMINWVRRAGVELRGGGVDESPHCYKRLPEVLEHHKHSIRVLHTLTPVGVAMAGAEEFDPYKD